MLLRPPSADDGRELARQLHFVLGSRREDVEVFVAVDGTELRCLQDSAAMPTQL